MIRCTWRVKKKEFRVNMVFQNTLTSSDFLQLFPTQEIDQIWKLSLITRPFYWENDWIRGTERRLVSQHDSIDSPPLPRFQNRCPCTQRLHLAILSPFFFFLKGSSPSSLAHEVVLYCQPPPHSFCSLNSRKVRHLKDNSPAAHLCVHRVKRGPAISQRWWKNKSIFRRTDSLEQPSQRAPINEKGVLEVHAAHIGTHARCSCGWWIIEKAAIKGVLRIRVRDGCETRANAWGSPAGEC